MVGALLGLTWLLFDQMIMPRYVRHGSIVELPDVVEMPLEDAVLFLESKGFRVVSGERRYTSFYPPDIVIDQNPPAHSQVKEERRVYLVVSVAERPLPVPRLVGLPERSALIMIEQSGFVAGALAYDYSAFPQGTVAEQSPLAGAELPRGASIDVTVSLGSQPDYFRVPQVLNKSLRQAEEVIARAGLRVGTVQYRLDESLIPYTVIAQSLEPGTILEERAGIGLIVSITDYSQVPELMPERGRLE